MSLFWLLKGRSGVALTQFQTVVVVVQPASLLLYEAYHAAETAALLLLLLLLLLSLQRSLTSRVTGVIPFFPFTELESMVVVQQQLLKVQQAMKAPPSEKIGRLFGRISVGLQDQPQVCMHCHYCGGTQVIMAVFVAVNRH
jgi:exosortase/archaeosortase